MLTKYMVTEVNFNGCAGDQHVMVPRDIGKIRRGEGGGWLHPQLHETYFDTEEEAVKAIESWGFNKTFYSIITVYRKGSKTCYQCEKDVEWLAPDSRCGDCTGYTPDEIRGV